MTVEEIPYDPRFLNRLGRTVRNHDPRNRGFAALAAPLKAPAGHRPGAVWATTDVYDQVGPSCTANAAIGVVRTSPYRTPWGKQQPSNPWPRYDSEQERFELYRAAQQVDQWPGDVYEGSSTDAPYIVLRNRGEISGWRWLFGEEEVREFVTNYGPCSIGVNWYDAMMNPDASGVLSVSGRNVGGHAIRVVQYHLERRAYRVVNSWGRGWGQGGRAWIPQAGMQRLLGEAGEAATPSIG